MYFYRLLILILFLASCKAKINKSEHSFYYWKTTFDADSMARSFIEKENISHFYIHYFDIAWSNSYEMPVPVAELSISGNALPFIQKNYTPVIYITNSCFEKVNSDWIDSMARKVSNKITYITNRIEMQRKDSIRQDPFKEIQIDCDWTSGTQENYFNFLRSFKKLYPEKLISVTIRLYPYKYPKQTGVPPADRGLLMCYNLSDIKDPGNRNSIFKFDLLKQYLKAKSYPLPLDVALPVFGWYAWFVNGKFNGIIYPDPASPILNNVAFRKKENNYTLLKDTTINNNYLREGDVLRTEYPDALELEEAAALLKKKLPAIERISFYYWNNELVNQYAQTIHHIYSSY